MNKVVKVTCAAMAVGAMGTSMAPVVAWAKAPAMVEVISVAVHPSSKLGPDKIMHDAFSKTNFAMTKGVPVEFIIKNYDTGEHSITSAKLGLNVIVKGATKAGPSTTTYKFTPEKAGTFHWQCVIPCDGQAKGWAMMHNGYMAGTIVVKK
ncbi:MAG: cupredoxin domain-containing protein [Alicyclobacillus sp.]|nr:cupredoxin domain-containing protein [Alicyclobacillus sp.]